MAKNVEQVIEEPITEEPKVEEPKAVKKPAKEIITLPLTSDKQEDVTVGINGFYTKIKRGVPVEVSRDVYEVLMNMQNMDNLAIRRRNALISK